MRCVDADTNQLQKIENDIRSALENIKRTKYNIKNKYKELGIDWNDKKYKYLGYILNECIRALNRLEEILQQCDKYILLLIKSLIDYENVFFNSNNTNSVNSFKQSLFDANASQNINVGYDYCLGVLLRGHLPSGYTNIIQARYDIAEKNVRDVFNLFSNQLIIQDINYPQNQTAHYCPNSYPNHNRGVYYNATSDMYNPRGNGTTYFHELGHMVDHCATGGHGNCSNTTEFQLALLEDGQQILSSFNSTTSERQAAFIDSLRNNNRTHSFQDLLDATTNGQIHVRWSHEREYWQRDGNLQAEAFAHFFEASMGGTDKLNWLKKYFPKSYKVFNSIINRLLSSEQVRVLERGH